MTTMKKTFSQEELLKHMQLLKMSRDRLRLELASYDGAIRAIEMLLIPKVKPEQKPTETESEEK